MQRRKLLWFAGVGIAAMFVQSGSGAAMAPPDDTAQGATQIVLARSGRPVPARQGAVHVPLRAMPTRTGAKARSLAALLQRVQQDEHVLLVLRGLHAAQPPNIVVQIYLGLAEGEAPTARTIRITPAR